MTLKTAVAADDIPNYPETEVEVLEHDDHFIVMRRTRWPEGAWNYWMVFGHCDSRHQADFVADAVRTYDEVQRAS